MSHGRGSGERSRGVLYLTIVSVEKAVSDALALTQKRKL